MRKENLIKYQKDVLNALNQLEGDRNKPYILTNGKTYSINDVIKEVESLSEFGMKQLRSWSKLQEYIKNKKK